MLAGLPRKETLFGFNEKTTVARDIFLKMVRSPFQSVMAL